MADKSVTPEVTPDDPATPVAPSIVPPPPKRSPGHRGADVKDTVAEMTAKAHEISLEAGSKMAAAMKDVVNAAAGLTGFVLESARDLVQYMVRRGQMTQEEADKLIHQAEEAQVGRPAATPPPHHVPSSVPHAPHPQKPEPKAAAKAAAPIKTKTAPPSKAAKTAAKKPAARTAHKSDRTAPKKAAKTAPKKATSKRK